MHLLYDCCNGLNGMSLRLFGTGYLVLSWCSCLGGGMRLEVWPWQRKYVTAVGFESLKGLLHFKFAFSISWWFDMWAFSCFCHHARCLQLCFLSEMVGMDSYLSLWICQPQINTLLSEWLWAWCFSIATEKEVMKLPPWKVEVRARKEAQWKRFLWKHNNLSSGA